MLIVGNWKAYVEDLKTARAVAAAAERAADKTRTIVLAPPAPLLAYLRDHTAKKVKFGVQDLSELPGGAVTGETTAALAAAAGAAYAIVGHSERRARGETDELVGRKAAAALAAGLIPIVCIGERERDPDARYLQGLRAQIDAVLGVLSPDQRARVVFAYEPLWAIGKAASQAANPDDLREMVLYFRKVFERALPQAGAQQVSILYGGAVNATNAAALVADTGIAGFLVGRASADPKQFAALLRALR